MTNINKQRLLFGRWNNYNISLGDSRFWWIKFKDPLEFIIFFHSSQN